jgi:alpha-ribazole phosphatase
MIKLYLARHGETDLNIKKVYYGWLDVSLNTKGISQCLYLRDKLAHAHFDEVFSSDLSRAFSSAMIMSGYGIEKITKLEELNELNFGKWEGMHYRDIEKSYSEEWNAWSSDWQNYTIPDGESFKDFYFRVKSGLENILNNEDKTLLLVAHEGTLKIISTILLNLNIEDYWKFSFEFGKYSLFEIEDGHVTIRNINC